LAYLGDGINDASALHSADVGISVESAVDVAKGAADIVLLERDLGVLAQGVRLGRQTFANTLKYVFITTSTNFGNMVRMAGASLFLPFLPLLPKQILLNNFLSDVPSMTIATDSVDREQVDRPRRSDIRFIRNFMLVFGLVSSVFDYLTFGALLYWLRPSSRLTRWSSSCHRSFVLLRCRASSPCEPHPCCVQSPPECTAACTVAGDGPVVGWTHLRFRPDPQPSLTKSTRDLSIR
jgi:Mg2+-importing ATPase